MNLAALTSADLKRLTKLIEQKESLLAEVARIDRALNDRSSGESAAKGIRRRAPKAAAKAVVSGPAKARKPGRRGHVKEAIINLLKSGGKEGYSVRDIASKLGAKAQNIYMWFSATGKSVKGIKKVGPGRYIWVG